MSVAQQIERLQKAKQEIKAALESKGVTVPESALLDAYPEQVEGIPLGTDTSDATATASQILSGYTAYAKGSKITGTIPTQAAKTITPGTSAQTISAGQYLSGAITVAGDSDLVPSNIRSGANIFGVSGNSYVVNTSGANATAAALRSGYTAYANGNYISGTMGSYSGTTSASVSPGSSYTFSTAGKYVGSNLTVTAGSSTCTRNHLKYTSSSQSAGTTPTVLNVGFYPTTIGQIVKRSSSLTFVMAYQMGTLYQSNDSGDYHSNTQVSVSGTTATITFKTGQNNTFTPIGTIYWFAAGYEV